MSINKNGIVTNKYFQEYHVEPDGSIWYKICYHNNPTNKKFSSTDPFTTGVYLDEDRWFHASILNQLTSWEFLWIQNTDAGGAIQKFRWSQSKNPFTATYEDVAPGKVTYNTSSGYINNGNGGLYKLNSSTFFCVANGTKGNWFGAAGAWAAHDGGIPGHPTGNTIRTGSLNLYVRVNNSKADIRKLGIIDFSNFYEI